MLGRPQTGEDLVRSMAHIRQSRPDSGRGFQVKVLKTVEVFPTQQRAVLPPGAMPPTPALSLSLSLTHPLSLSHALGGEDKGPGWRWRP